MAGTTAICSWEESPTNSSPHSAISLCSSGQARKVGTPPEELFAESDTECFYKDHVHITFIRGGDGRANRLVLHQGGSDTVGIRIEAGTDDARRSFFGTQVSPLCDDVRQREHLGDRNGIVVDKVLPRSTAAEAGLERGDIILSINESKVTDVVGFLVQVSMIQPGGTVDVEIIRAGKGSSNAAR